MFLIKKLTIDRKTVKSFMGILIFCVNLINKIEVDKDGNVDIYLRLIGDLGLDETVLIEGTEDSEVDYEVAIDKTVPNRHNHT